MSRLEPNERHLRVINGPVPEHDGPRRAALDSNVDKARVHTLQLQMFTLPQFHLFSAESAESPERDPIRKRLPRCLCAKCRRVVTYPKDSDPCE